MSIMIITYNTGW